MTLLKGYFSDLSRQLHLDLRETQEILRELEGHVEDRVRELTERGMPREQALRQALQELGASRHVAERFYEVHSQCSWPHTALAAFPHLLLALLFALHLWTAPVWVVLLLVTATVISFVGWRMGKPTWTYPWLGYCLVPPIISWGLAMSAVAYGAWSIIVRGYLPLSIPIYIASFLYFAFSLWAVIRIVSQVSRRDWVMGSLTVLPVPFLAYWFFYFYSRREVLQAAGHRVSEVDSSAAVVFLVLALATVVFFRIGRRLVRVALLTITAPSLIVLAWLSYQGGPGFLALFTFSAISLLVLLLPALLDRGGAEVAVPARATVEDGD